MWTVQCSSCERQCTILRRVVLLAVGTGNSLNSVTTFEISASYTYREHLLNSWKPVNIRRKEKLLIPKWSLCGWTSVTFTVHRLWQQQQINEEGYKTKKIQKSYIKKEKNLVRTKLLQFQVNLLSVPSNFLFLWWKWEFNGGRETISPP